MTLPAAQLLHEPDSKTLAFKRELSSPRPWLKTLVAFANSAGGRLVFGVADDRQVVGIDRENAHGHRFEEMARRMRNGANKHHLNVTESSHIKIPVPTWSNSTTLGCRQSEGVNYE